MIEVPKTTYTFSSWTVDSNGEDREVKIEFSTREETLTDMCERFGDFLRATGFSYVKDVVAYDTWEDERYEDSEPDTSLDFEEEFDPNQLSMDFAGDSVTYTIDTEVPIETSSFSVYPGDINVTVDTPIWSTSDSYDNITVNLGEKTKKD